ncbi:hypothetical protein J2Y46_003880 [Microbacterium sp. BE35]|uniref:hypothetical protein n=1 Tax=Microbacterium sp. BE35 TaxID=2817773 RepID=UPI00285BAB46|nr:hypothetical protein [Microbacterium sp. BE35]MDR7191022.1 hypothetical protein [Microbacterium sp. BE35]
MTEEPRDGRAVPTLTDEDEAFALALIGIRDRELRGFAAPSASFEADSATVQYRFAPSAASVADIIEMVLGVTRARHQPAYEKVAWIREFDFRRTTCRLQWGKFGLRLTILLSEERDEGADELGKEVERRLTAAATSLYQRAIYPRVQRELRENRATVVNQFARYRGAVDFHLAHLRQMRNAGVPESRPIRDDSHDALLSILERAMAEAAHRREVAYVCTAVIATYFAYVQHALVVLSAFSPAALRPVFSLQKLLKAGWADQFDVAFPAPHAGQISRAKHALNHIAKNHRGRLLHGGGGHPADGVVVQWAPGRRSLVSEDGKPSAQFMLLQAPLSAEEVDDILERINHVDEALESHPYFHWLRSGLEADFHSQAIEYALRMTKEGKASEYIGYANDSFDRAVNWD